MLGIAFVSLSTGGHDARRDHGRPRGLAGGDRGAADVADVPRDGLPRAASTAGDARGRVAGPGERCRARAAEGLPLQHLARDADADHDRAGQPRGAPAQRRLVARGDRGGARHRRRRALAHDAAAAAAAAARARGRAGSRRAVPTDVDALLDEVHARWAHIGETEVVLDAGGVGQRAARPRRDRARPRRAARERGAAHPAGRPHRAALARGSAGTS